MKESLKTGVSFGFTSSIITTLGLMMGLYSGTQSKLAVLGGIITIAVADAASDALGIHISEESENKHTPLEIWVSTISTFFSKLLFALTFVVPLMLFSLSDAVVVSIVWGLASLSVLSYFLARSDNNKPLPVIVEHLTIASCVIVLTYYLGIWVSETFV